MGKCLEVKRLKLCLGKYILTVGLEVEGFALEWRKRKTGHKEGRMDPDVNKFIPFIGESDAGHSDRSVWGTFSRFSKDTIIHSTCPTTVCQALLLHISLVNETARLFAFKWLTFQVWEIGKETLTKIK